MAFEKVPEFKFVITDDPYLEARLLETIKKTKWEIRPLEHLSDLESVSKDAIVIVLFYLRSSTLEKRHPELHDFLRLNPSILSYFVLQASIEYAGYLNLKIEDELIYTILPENTPPLLLTKTFVNAFAGLQMTVEKFELQKRINVSANEITKLTKIGISLANEKDFTKLLRDILNSAREISNSDSGSLYLVEKDEKGNPKNLRFKISALDLTSNEFILPINKKSIAGFVAYTGKGLNIPDVYQLSEQEEYRFNNEIDNKTEYHTKSMLTVPMKDHRDEVVGVIQLINRKKNFRTKLTLSELNSELVLPFDKYTEDLVMAVAGQAAVAIQNNNLIHDIETLFEGFVTASVSAIESRDPTTSGHSFRVAKYTVNLAEAVNRLTVGKFKEIQFSNSQIKEIRYASLLHDFGKVGVREKVLVKAKKLEDFEIELIKWRFQYVQKDLESKFRQRKIDYLLHHGRTSYPDFEKALELEYQEESQRLSKMVQVIMESNEPSILEESNSNHLEEISKCSYETTDHKHVHLLQSREFSFLSIRKGSLDFEERREIESHVEHTFQFLSKIPWTKDLKMVPAIAHAHHEKLDGGGYPRGLQDTEIPIQSKMMAISDIFDALTDKDRPYKKAVPLERALDILKMEVKDHHIDGDLLDVFIEAKVFEDILQPRIKSI